MPPEDLVPSDYVVEGLGTGGGYGGTGGGYGDGVGGGVAAECNAICEQSVAYKKYRDAGFFEGEISVSCSDPSLETVTCNVTADCSAGRRASGQALHAQPCENARDYWRAMAALEQSAVVAFNELALTLRHHGAPQALVQRALIAAEDERRHTAVALRLCDEPELPAQNGAPRAPLTLLELAHLNAREGCVLESFAALQVAWQARSVADPQLAVELAEIALDEASHAELAWDVDAWLATVLTLEERAEMELVRREAAAELPAFERSAAWLPEVGLQARAGLSRLRAEFVATLAA
jgi:hypothetical protein